MKTNEAKGKAIKILTNAGCKVSDMIVTGEPKKPMVVRNQLSDIYFINADGNESTYQLSQIGSVLMLVEVEI